jgi:ubiquinone/menaquinone biosynthesis C-methylase UbiE
MEVGIITKLQFFATRHKQEILMLKRDIYYLLTPGLRFFIRRLYYLPIDIYEKLTGKRDDLTPPRGLVFVGFGDFKKSGELLLDQIKNVVNLQPKLTVLDVGCGIGRLAVPLTKILNKEGRYEGFDIVKIGIDWCNKNIKPKYPNFNFIHIDLKNDLYNLKTNKEAKNFIFPYKDNEFDLVILTSVFTHMMPEDVNNYLKEIFRVLKKDGKCFVTFFLLNDEIKSSIENRNYFNFPFKYDNYRLLDKNVKEANIAYEEDFLVNNLFNNNKFRVERIDYGWWSGKSRENALGYQDTMLLSKKT